MGPTALTFYRAARRLRRLGVPLLPAWVSAVGDRLLHSHVDIDARLHATVDLGYGGVGVVVAPGVEVGEGSFLSQNVSVEPRLGEAEAPRIGRNVYVGVGAQIIGPVTVGDDAVIGAGARVTSDIPPRAVVVGDPARVVKYKPSRQH
ncbi:DapH/DapD/GlmU-related protein [Myxococcus stipitatus]|uniref:DapH/DapD/GlmU-related protein n=1 Tax=Myxococcus stipitatus TaxID=83455 RepID=UPI0030D38CE6